MSLMPDEFVDKIRSLSSDGVYHIKSFHLEHIRIQNLFAKKDGSQSLLIYSLLSSVLLLTLTGLLFSSAFAQQTPGPQSEEKALSPPGNISSNNDRNDTVLNATGTDLPILQKLSDNRNYIVQIRWGQDPTLLAASGFDMEIVFLNASEPEATPQTFPQKETNLTGGSTLGSSFFTDPSIIQRMLPIEGYDITVYSDNGKELWKKANQPVHAGRAYERVTFENPYTGAITIQINNIKSGGSMGGTLGGALSGSNENKSSDERLATDSVKFTARVVESNP
jgi:hypothetical protein